MNLRLIELIKKEKNIILNIKENLWDFLNKNWV
jgi:hypothetical protein